MTSPWCQKIGSLSPGTGGRVSQASFVDVGGRQERARRPHRDVWTSCVRMMSAAAVCACVGVVASAQSDYQLRLEDTINITVVNQPDLSRQYVVDQNGNLRLPLIGQLQVVGLTAREVAAELRRRLAEFFTDPQVSVDIERTMRVFVFGGVRAPGMYELTENMTLIELLANAGTEGASEALIIRRQGLITPILPDTDADTDVIRVNLREFEKDLLSGTLSRNVVLEEGDTIYIPRVDPNRIYVSGEVRNSGAFSVPEGTTVLQALTLAGGPTPGAALNRIKVLRLVDGSNEELDAELEDIVQPGDTILVPERFF